MDDLIKRYSIEDIYKIKLSFINQINALQKLEDDIKQTAELIDGHAPFHINYRFDIYGEHPEIKYVDRTCWRYLIKFFKLNKYMLCTDFKQLSEEIEKFNFPEFTIENVEGWVTGLKSLIYDNVKTLVKSVFKNITDGTYYTGSGYSSRQKKKRNNNGIDKNFILHTYDHSAIFGYHWNKPTITDDLEKVCYIMDGKTVPDITIKDQMRSDRKAEAYNQYFQIKTCKNGNTHYILNEESRTKLNLYGPEGSIIGENIRIKIFNEKW